MLAGCGGENRTAPARAPTVAAYAGSVDRLCSELVGALALAFEDAPGDPEAAIARYARGVGAAGRRFATVAPPRSLARFAAATARHVQREAALLRRAATRGARGDAGAALRALARHQNLLPRGIPTPVLRRAPACGGMGPAPASPPPGDGEVVAARAAAGAEPAA